MLTRRDAVMLSLGAAASRPGFSKDFWLEKKPDQWSEKDIEKLLSRSPWAKEVYAEMNMGGGGTGRGGGRGMSAEAGSPMGGPGGGGGGGGDMGGGGGGGGGGGRRGGGGGGGMEPPVMPQIKALVRWETAPLVRAAAKTALPKEVAEHYVVSLTTQGMPGGGGARGGAGRPEGAEPPDPEARRKAMLQRMGQTTTLQRKGKDPLHVEHVLSGKDTEKTLVLFLFPRDAQPITADDKEVIFVSRIGPAEFKAKFNLKDMMYDGKLDL